MKHYYVYVLTDRNNGVLYTGVTNNLIKRTYEHKKEVVEGFTKKYKLHKLVYFEQYRDVREALLREKQIKRWKRSWKIELIEKNNPVWEDLYYNLLG